MLYPLLSLWEFVLSCLTDKIPQSFQCNGFSEAASLCRWSAVFAMKSVIFQLSNLKYRLFESAQFSSLPSWFWMTALSSSLFVILSNFVSPTASYLSSVPCICSQNSAEKFEQHWLYTDPCSLSLDDSPLTVTVWDLSISMFTVQLMCALLAVYAGLCNCNATGVPSSEKPYLPFCSVPPIIKSN